MAVAVLLLIAASPAAVVLAIVLLRRVRVLEDEMRELRARERPVAPAEPVPPRPEAPPVPAPARASEPPPELVFEPDPAPAPKTAPQPRTVPPLPPRRSRLRDMEWERWIGVRGAAVVGGILLALAAILLFRHAIVSGWIGPWQRVISGGVTGVLLIVAGRLLARREFRFAPGALIGAGIVALYASLYAADQRYGLIGLAVSFPGMAAVTVLAGWLAVRQRSGLTAVLGLVGGFATPFLLSSGSDRPFELFGYVLLLDVGLLYVGRTTRWTWVAILGVIGTFIVEAAWVFARMGSERIELGITFVALFALTFTAVTTFVRREERRAWLPAQAGAVLLPFAFALYFASTIRVEEPWTNAALVGLLSAAGAFLARQQRAPWLARGAVVSAVPVVAVWFLRTQATRTDCLQLSLIATLLALIPHAFLEWEVRRDTRRIAGVAAPLSAVAWALVFAVAGPIAYRAPDYALFFGVLGIALLLGYGLGSIAPGEEPMVFPDGYAKLLVKGSTINFNMHYHKEKGVGTGAWDESQVAFKFHPKDAKIEHFVDHGSVGRANFVVPPQHPKWKVGTAKVFDVDTTIIAMHPHMHLRGKDAKYVAHYPDGSNETLLYVPQFDFNWQSDYSFREPKKLPAGTRLEYTAHFDNSAENPANPNPDIAVPPGRETWDEMMIGYITFAESEPRELDVEETIEQRFTTARELSEEEEDEEADTSAN